MYKNPQTKELINAQKRLPEHKNKDPNGLPITLTLNASKHKVHNPYQRYIPVYLLPCLLLRIPSTAGHVIRMAGHRVPKQITYGELSKGKKNQSRSRKRYKDNLKTHPRLDEIKPMNLEGSSPDRTEWPAVTWKAAFSFQND